MNFLERAEILTRYGIPVIPVLPKQKRAFIENWQHAATTDSEQLRKWNRQYPRHNTGAVAKRDGFLILDLDHLAAYQSLLEAGIDLKQVRTFKVQGKKGSPLGHYYFRHTEITRPLGNCSWEIRSRRTGKKIDTYFDLKGHNGYVVGPGSIHPEGPEYTVVEDSPVSNMPDRLAQWIGAHRAVVWLEDAPSASSNGQGNRGAWRDGNLRTRTLDILANCRGKSYEEIKAVIGRYGYGHRHEADQAIAEYLFLTHKGNRSAAEAEFRRVALHQDRTDSYFQLTLDKAAKWYAVTRDTKSAEGAVLVPSEDDLALRLSARHPDLRYTARWGMWHEWTAPKWVEDDTVRVYDLAREVCREAGERLGEKHAGARSGLMRASTVSGVERLARSDRRHAMSVAFWDAHPWLLNTPGGTVDLRTGELRPARPEDYLTKSTRVEPNGSLPARWLDFLAEIFDGDAGVIAHIQKWAGYSLTGDTREHALMFCHGEGANGKSTLWNTLVWILGDYADTAASETFMVNRNERHPEELASLRGLRLVIASEISEGCRWNESRIKDLTGGDAVRARFMRQDSFSFQPEFKLIIFGNHKPRLRSVDEAMKRRLHFVSFDVTIPTQNRDPELRQKLQAEAGGILQWAIAGCLLWQQEGLDKPAKVEASTQLYFSDQDRLGDWIAEKCERGADLVTPTNLLYGSWKAWAEANGEWAGSCREFRERLLGRPGLGEARKDNVRSIRGLRLLEEMAFAKTATDSYLDRMARARVYTGDNGKSGSSGSDVDFERLGCNGKGIEPEGEL